MNKPPDAPKRSPLNAQAPWRINLKCADWGQAQKLAALHTSRGSVSLNSVNPVAAGTPVELALVLPDGRRINLKGTVQEVVGAERAAAEGRSPGVGVKLDPQHEAELKRIAEIGVGSKGSAKPSPSPGHSAAPALRPRPPGAIAPAVGIDFGTTYTSISVAIGDQVLVIPDEGGRTLQPSLVAFPEGGAPLVGWKARPMLVQDPRRAVSSAKRLLGRKFSDSTIAGLLQMSAFKSSQGINGVIMVEVDDNKRSIIEICSAVISHVRSVAEAYLGTRITQAVFTVPVSFGPPQHDALRRAAKLAHLEVLDLIEEPVAGALAYGIGQQKNAMVAIYDFGGGTFDFSILDFVHDHFRVLGTKGDPWLGGDDFDSALAQHIADKFWRDHQVELRQRAVEWQRLLIACERAKRKLSTETAAELFIEGIVDTPSSINIQEMISRAQFEHLCRELVDRSLSVCRDSLEALKLEPSDVTELVLTGGVSSIPMVRQAVSQLFEREITQPVSPEEAVALGAGIRAAQRVNHSVRGIASSQR